MVNVAKTMGRPSTHWRGYQGYCGYSTLLVLPLLLYRSRKLSLLAWHIEICTRAVATIHALNDDGSADSRGTLPYHVQDVAWQGWPVACASHHPACLVWTYCTARSGAIRNVATSSALQVDTEKHAPSPAGQFRAPQQDNSPMRHARKRAPARGVRQPSGPRATNEAAPPTEAVEMDCSTDSVAASELAVAMERLRHDALASPRKRTD